MVYVINGLHCMSETVEMLFFFFWGGGGGGGGGIVGEGDDHIRLKA